MYHVVKRNAKGFTLIELMLAMTFISILLMAIAMTIIQIGAQYNKGMTIKEANQAGRSISEDFGRNVGAADAFSMVNDYATTTTGARVCMGNYTYIWNTGKMKTNSAVVKYLQPGKTDDVNLVKVEDPSKLYCVKLNGALVQKDILATDTAKTQELLPPGEHDLAVQAISIVPNDDTTTRDPITRQQLYRFNFIIGTNNQNALNSTQTGCLPPSDIQSDINYCVVEHFSLVVRAGYGVN